MTTQYQLRKVFTQHWCDPDSQVGKNAWLIKGDFDHFKLTNDLYGSLISDYLLDWTLEVIETELKSHQQLLGSDGLLWNFVGDDVTIYVPPSRLQEQDVEQLLWRICDAIEKSFYRRYMLAALPLPSGYFEDVPPASLEMLRNDLEIMEIVLDFTKKQQGYIMLFPVEEESIYGQTIEMACRTIEKWTGKPILPQEVQMDWIWDPEQQTAHSFNDGYLLPPSISFAALSIEMERKDGQAHHDRRSMYERVSLACQSALRTCKQQRMQVYLQTEDGIPLEPYLVYQPAGIADLNSPLRWSSERYLRETYYFRSFDQPVLFQFNPVYCSNSEKFTSILANDVLAAEKYRGNQYGVGLKGINEIFGHTTATHLIGKLMSAFSEVMQSVLIDRRIPLESVHIARFVDRFTVCCERPVFDLPGIIELVHRLTSLFNCLSNEIKISHARANVVFGDPQAIGYLLFQQLTLTGLSSQSMIVQNSNPPIEVRQNHPLTVLQEGSRVLERNCLLSARLLEPYRVGRNPMMAGFS